jgi:hypothetical protein
MSGRKADGADGGLARKSAVRKPDGADGGQAYDRSVDASGVPLLSIAVGYIGRKPGGVEGG